MCVSISGISVIYYKYNAEFMWKPSARVTPMLSYKKVWCVFQ